MNGAVTAPLTRLRGPLTLSLPCIIKVLVVPTRVEMTNVITGKPCEVVVVSGSELRPLTRMLLEVTVAIILGLSPKWC